MTQDSQSVKNQNTSIAPMLSVRRGAKAVEFYKAAFGAGELFRLDNDSGEVVAQLSVGAAQFWVADESPENLNFSPQSLGGGSVRMVMVVDDPDAAFARAVSAGAGVISPVADQPYGWRVGRIVDPLDTIGKSASPCRRAPESSMRSLGFSMLLVFRSALIWLNQRQEVHSNTHSSLTRKFASEHSAIAIPLATR